MCRAVGVPILRELTDRIMPRLYSSRHLPPRATLPINMVLLAMPQATLGSLRTSTTPSVVPCCSHPAQGRLLMPYAMRRQLLIVGSTEAMDGAINSEPAILTGCSAGYYSCKTVELIPARPATSHAGLAEEPSCSQAPCTSTSVTIPL